MDINDDVRKVCRDLVELIFAGRNVYRIKRFTDGHSKLLFHLVRQDGSILIFTITTLSRFLSTGHYYRPEDYRIAALGCIDSDTAFIVETACGSLSSYYSDLRAEIEDILEEVPSL